MSKSNQASQDTEQERIEGEEQFMNEPIITPFPIIVRVNDRFNFPSHLLF